MVAEEKGPLAALRDHRRLPGYVDDGEPILALDRHEQPRHEGEVEGHVTLVPLAEIGDRILGPLVRFCQQYSVLKPVVDVAAELLQEGVRLRQVLAAGALALVEIGHGVEAEPVHAELQPEVDDSEHRPPHVGMVVVEVGLVSVEPVPVVRLGDRVPAPVRWLEVLEDDAGVPAFLGRVAPHVELTPAAARLGQAGPLEPRMLVRGVVEDQLSDDPEAAVVRLPQEHLETAHRAVDGADPGVVGDVVAVVLHRRGIEGEEPEDSDPEVLEIVELLG